MALPFSLTLDRFEVETYPGTHSPMDFVSYLQIHDGGENTDAKISMNHILKHRHYRFYQSDYDEEGNSVLSVAHDPWGTGVTYAGYFLLFIALIGLFFDPNGQFRTMLRKVSDKAVLLIVLLTLGAATPALAGNKERRQNGTNVCDVQRPCVPIANAGKGFHHQTMRQRHLSRIYARTSVRRMAVLF